MNAEIQQPPWNISVHFGAESFGVKQLILNTVLHTFILKIVCILVNNSVHNYFVLTKEIPALDRECPREADNHNLALE